MKPVGISILTNGRRRDRLERCVNSLLCNCYFRPLTIGVMNNGSLDDTSDWMQNLPSIYGVEWRAHSSDVDRGCAWGTNKSIELVEDCEFQLHLESDFEHLEGDESGVDKMWLHRAIGLLQSGECDYLYLRRMRDHNEAAMHWWAQWMPQITEERGEFLSCPSFWWSNNPAVFRTQALFDCGTLPLDEGADGPKGSNAWSVPELGTKKPSKPWIHRWGVFVHERQAEKFDDKCCGVSGPYGYSGCKYGFLVAPGDAWCAHCDPSESFSDMVKHQQRYRHQRASSVSSHAHQAIHGVSLTQ